MRITWFFFFQFDLSTLNRFTPNRIATAVKRSWTLKLIKYAVQCTAKNHVAVVVGGSGGGRWWGRLGNCMENVNFMYAHARWELPQATQVFVAVFMLCISSVINSLVCIMKCCTSWPGHTGVDGHLQHCGRRGDYHTVNGGSCWRVRGVPHVYQRDLQGQLVLQARSELVLRFWWVCKLTNLKMFTKHTIKNIKIQTHKC